MTNEAMRFLALNAVLHGYDVTAAFEDSIDKMAECLEVDHEEAVKLHNGLQDLPIVEVTPDAMVATFLNYFRNDAYTFVSMGPNPVPLSKFVANDLEGQVSDELRYMFLTQLIRDVSQGDMYIEPCIVDGVLRCTPEAFQTVQQAMVEAYQLYMTGPVGTPKGLYTALRKYTSLEYYAPLSAAMLLRIFRQIIRCKKNALVYQQTMLTTPDLLDTYKHTGCIMAFRDSTHTSVSWLLDRSDVAEATVSLPADMSVLKTYLLRDVKDLSNIKAAKGVGETVKIMFPEVV